MNTIELSKFSLQEKFQMMESIWEELRSRVDEAAVPQSHRDILDERRHLVENGESELLEWDQVKHGIGQG